MPTPDAATPDDMPPDDSVMAAELALGLVEGEDRAVALRRTMAEPGFAREVERWRAHFASLLDGVTPVAPPPELEARVMRAIDGGAGKWRWATGVASLMAAALAGVLVLRPPERVMVRVPGAPTTMPIGLTAAMVPSDAAPEGGKPFVAIYDPASGAVRVAGDLAVPSERDAELWRIGTDGVPKSLGLMVAVGRSTITLPRADRDALAAGVTLAVSIEPKGGSPTGLPTGPVVATGALVRL
ncbi:anti-sigma factor [Sphingomonas sp. SUN019]|uniref:anti-sigma factor n=1 Tax=Sphingomonas sp. SUN019 TaxID=2937788 RepID=UPI00216460BF|nr:anti-sigma factor [Sphingomonas sp. SUN019]UVO51352.1 anti-sigma factor [Sphingomonas sp. SUN019]